MGVTQDAKTISGFEHMRELVRWAFDAKQGEVSPVITVDNEYFFVAAVAGIHEEGIATLEEKRAEIESILTLEKKKTVFTIGSVRNCHHTQPWKVGQKLPEETSQKQTGIAFGSVQQTDPKFVGAASAAPEQTLCGPVKGEVGVYVSAWTNVRTELFYTENDAMQYASLSGQYTNPDGTHGLAGNSGCRR